MAKHKCHLHKRHNMSKPSFQLHPDHTRSWPCKLVLPKYHGFRKAPAGPSCRVLPMSACAFNELSIPDFHFLVDQFHLRSGCFFVVRLVGLKCFQTSSMQKCSSQVLHQAKPSSLPKALKPPQKSSSSCCRPKNSLTKGLNHAPWLLAQQLQNCWPPAITAWLKSPFGFKPSCRVI